MRRKDDRLVTYNLGIQYENRNICISVAGHVRDLCLWHDDPSSMLPETESGVGKWCNKADSFLSRQYKAAQNVPDIGELLKQTGLLVVHRVFLDPTEYRFRHDEGLHTILCDLSIPKDATDLLRAIEKHNLKPANAFLVERTVCSRCGEAYARCGCSKYREEGVVELMDKVTLLGPFWTTRRA